MIFTQIKNYLIHKSVLILKILKNISQFPQK